MNALFRLLHLRPGEIRRATWVGLIGICYAAATSLGDDIAQSIFVTRVGAQSMPVVFLFKGLLDVAAAALYLPLTRRRGPARVWQVAVLIYIATVISARLLVTDGSALSAYALFVGHECAWTILTIHWGVFILDAFDASQARRLFPLLFTAARVGGILAGVVLRQLAEPVGAANLLFAAAGAAALAGGLSLWSRGAPRGRTDPTRSARFSVQSPEQAETDDEVDPSPPAAPARGTLSSWAAATRSPLVRIIAWSTAAMVLVRYALNMVAIDQISTSFGDDGEMVAEFLGMFGAIANAVGIVLGVLVVPRLLSRLGVGFANLAYGVATVLSFAGLLVYPALGAAAFARFTRIQLKDSLKTPLSTLFYGAEPPPLRAPSRAFVFGLAIPVATVVTAGILELCRQVGHHLTLVVAIGLAAAAIFTLLCAVQNRRWRRRLAELLDWKLARAHPAPPDRLAEVAALLADSRAAADGPTTERIDAIARGLASDDPRLRAVGEELLSETISRHRAHQIAATVAAERAGAPTAR